MSTVAPEFESYLRPSASWLPAAHIKAVKFFFPKEFVVATFPSAPTFIYSSVNLVLRSIVAIISGVQPRSDLSALFTSAPKTFLRIHSLLLLTKGLNHFCQMHNVFLFS